MESSAAIILSVGLVKGVLPSRFLLWKTYEVNAIYRKVNQNFFPLDNSEYSKGYMVISILVKNYIRHNK